MTNVKLASVMLALIASAIAMPTSEAAAARRSHHQAPSSESKRIAALTSELAAFRRELALFRRDFRPGSVAELPLPPKNPSNTVVASLVDLPKEAPLDPKQRTIDPLSPVMPATATQRGQWNDRRRTHRHAGIDLGGEYGSPILAAYAGRVLPAPGGDRGYGPHCLVIQGEDGIVYRYAHLSSVSVKVGQHVETGQRIGGMGKVGRHGFTHLHFEMMRVADYKRRPYGLHKLDPNDYLGGGRGKRMVAGAPMLGQSATAYAKLGAH